MKEQISKRGRDRDFHFHPSEIGVVGFSGSGKTTIIEKLMTRWSCHFDVGYVKHDAHRIEMDREGKDTDRIRKAGASLVMINNHQQSAILSTGDLGTAVGKMTEQSLLGPKDFVVVEGYKDLEMDQIVVLDPGMEILMRLGNQESSRKRMFVGAAPSSPSPECLPYFQRDNIDGMAAAAERMLKARQKAHPFYGLVLGGGRSVRMGQDKGLLKYGEHLQLEVCQGLLAPHCSTTFLSGRQGQWDDAVLPQLSRIYDSFCDMGPLGGILSAMKQHPEAGWLVLAVDLPMLSVGALNFLVSRRNPFKYATVFQAQNDSGKKHVVEPLCAIYEPKCFSKFLEFVGIGRSCPSFILGQLPVEKLEAVFSRELTNINFPDERQSVLANMEASQ